MLRRLKIRQSTNEHKMDDIKLSNVQSSNESVNKGDMDRLWIKGRTLN